MSMRINFNLNGLSRQKGIGVIEIMLGSIIFILVVYFMFTLFARGKASFDKISAATNIMTIAANLQQAFRGQGTFSGLNVAAVVNNRIAPREMIVNGQVISPWNTPIEFRPQNGPGGTPNTAARITITGVDQEACASFVNAVQEPFFRILVNGQVVKDMSANKMIDTVAVGTACNPDGGVAATIDLDLTR